MRNLFNQELLLRLISVLLFIPIMLIPIIYSNYLLVFIYLLFNAIILLELNGMKKLNSNNNLIYITQFVIVYTFFLFILFVTLEIYKPYQILEIIVTIWLFDTFSYLGGKVLSGKKLIPKISSGKTISGLLSGILLTLLIIQLYQHYFIHDSSKSIYYFITIIFFAFTGDLFASVVKRKSKVKDSGKIMPGHGGLFDRLDSFVGVFFVLMSYKLFI